MTAPALARRGSDQEDRVYTWPAPPAPPEIVVPSVTSIIGKLAKPILINWAAKSVAEFAVEHILAWQELPPAAAVDVLKRSPYRNSDEAKKRGTAVHNAIDAYLGKEPVVEDLDLLPFIGGALAFMEDHVERVLEHEKTVFNRAYQYAGTFDMIALLKDNRIAICDWKTGSGIYPEVALQLSAYANGEFLADDETAETRDLPPIDVGFVVHLRGDGKYIAREVELTPRAWKTFTALRTIQLWKDDYEADALGKSHKGSAKPAENNKGG